MKQQHNTFKWIAIAIVLAALLGFAITLPTVSAPGAGLWRCPSAAERAEAGMNKEDVPCGSHPLFI